MFSQTKRKWNIEKGRLGLLLVIAALVVFFSISSPYFLKSKNLLNMLVSVSVIGIISTTMTTAIICRGPDLTVGAMVAMVGCLEAKLVMEMGLPWYIGILSSLGVGCVAGFLSGVIITRFTLAPMIVTLGMMNVVRGLCYVMTGGLSTFIQHPALTVFGKGRLVGIPISVIIMIICFVLFEVISKKTVFGRWIYACGSNREACRLAGIQVNRIVIAVFTLSGIFSAIAGVVMVGIGGTAMPSTGESYNMDAITAVLLGGTALDGGSGSVLGTLLGLITIGIISNGLTLLNVPSYWQTVAKGALLLAAVILDKRRSVSRR